VAAKNNDDMVCELEMDMSDLTDRIRFQFLDLYRGRDVEVVKSMYELLTVAAEMQNKSCDVAEELKKESRIFHPFNLGEAVYEAHFDIMMDINTHGRL